MTSSGNFSKAESVGAKTVNGPSSERVFAKPASTAALSKVLKLPALLATLTILSAFALSEAPTSNKDKKNFIRIKLAPTCSRTNFVNLFFSFFIGFF